MKILYKTCTGHIHKYKEQLNSQTQFCSQTKWDILKSEIHLFTISFSKNLSQLRRTIHTWKEIKNVGIKFREILEKHNKCKNKLEKMYDNTSGVKVRSKILWYEEEQKIIRFFFKLRKSKTGS